MKREDPVEDIIAETTTAIIDAYERGIHCGIQKQTIVNERLANPRIILKDFITFVKKFKLVKYEDELLYSNGEHALTDESLISSFLMRTDYEEKD
jgi:hypothetical protein